MVYAFLLGSVHDFTVSVTTDNEVPIQSGRIPRRFSRLTIVQFLELFKLVPVLLEPGKRRADTHGHEWLRVPVDVATGNLEDSPSPFGPISLSLVPSMLGSVVI